MSTTTAETKRIARQYPEDVATEGNLDLLEDLLTEDYVETSPLGELHGPAEAREQIQAIHRGVSDFSATVEDAIAEEDTAAMRVTLRGTHDGEFMGVEPTGREFEIGNAVFTRVADGKIAERWIYPDMLGMLVQVGAVEMPFEQVE